MMETMQFYYNSGLPQRQRRSSGRDTRTNGINKDVPSFLVFPDGSHSLGVISPTSTRPDEDPGTQLSVLLGVVLCDGCKFAAANQDSTITGPFVVWADPVVGLASSQSSNDNTYYTRHAFYLLLVINFIFCSMILADTVANQNSQLPGITNFSMPPLELIAVSFTLGIMAKTLGAWGVHKQRIQHISAFIAIELLLTILNFLWVGSMSQMLVISLDLMLLGCGIYIRSLYMGSWFSATR